MRGTLARIPAARPFDQEERRTALWSNDRSAPYDFCVRVEVRSQMPRSALEAVRPGVTPKASSRTSTPAYSSGHHVNPDGEV